MSLQKRIIEKKNIDYSLVPEFPYKNMLIELTNVCNHSCVFCANSKMTRKKGAINETFLKRLLKEAHDEGVNEVGFYATGEPFISNNLNQYVGWAKDIGYQYVYLTTNGALATPERVKPVLDAGLDSIKFSINAGSRETYNMIHGKDEFNKVMENLAFVAKYRRDKALDLKIYASFIATKYTKKEENQYKKKVEDLVDEIVFLDVGNQGGMMYEINELLALETGKYQEKSLPCSLLFNSINITYEGYLTACCIDFQGYLVVADLNNMSLREAWYCKTFKELREKHLTNSIEHTLCYNCIYNKNEEVEPLKNEYATPYHAKSFMKNNEVKERIDKSRD